MIDNTCDFEMISFIDGFSGYNQIKMYPENEKHTSFRTPLGVYCYTIMPFGLKNAGATFQRAMNVIFYEHIRKIVDCYADDIAVKSHEKGKATSRRSKKSVRHHAGSPVEDEPNQVFLGAASGKFFGFVVTSKGIHLDLEKVRAIQEMQPPRNLKKLRGLQERLAYTRRFILNLSGCCQPFTKLMKKGVSFVWDSACQQAFKEIKECLIHPPVLVASVSEKSFLLYVRAMDHCLGALLAQNND